MVALCSFTIRAKSSSNDSILIKFCTLDVMGGEKLQENHSFSEILHFYMLIG